MSRFYVSIIPDNKAMVTRCGHHFIGAHIRGWHVGCRVEVRADEEGKDHLYVYKTGGSTGATSDILVASFTNNFLWTK